MSNWICSYRNGCTRVEREQIFYTNYPFGELGDTLGKDAPMRECEVLSYDGDKRCNIIVEGVRGHIKSGYIYPTKTGRTSICRTMTLYGIPTDTSC